MIERYERHDETMIGAQIAANRPTVFAAVSGKEQLASWNIDQLEQWVGERLCSTAVSTQPRYEYDPRFGLNVESMTFRDFSARAFSSERGGRYYYLQEDLRALPELAPRCVLPATFARNFAQAKLWVSSGGLITSLHYDPVETYLWQLVGTKRVLLFPPGIDGYYPHPWTTKAPFVSQLNVDAPNYEAFPRFRERRPCEVLLRPGELLYLPFAWWHQVYSLDAANVSVNFRWFAGPRKTFKHWPQYARTLPLMISRVLATQRAKPRRAG